MRRTRVYEPISTFWAHPGAWVCDRKFLTIFQVCHRKRLVELEDEEFVLYDAAGGEHAELDCEALQTHHLEKVRTYVSSGKLALKITPHVSGVLLTLGNTRKLVELPRELDELDIAAHTLADFFDGELTYTEHNQQEVDNYASTTRSADFSKSDSVCAVESQDPSRRRSMRPASAGTGEIDSSSDLQQVEQRTLFESTSDADTRSSSVSTSASRRRSKQAAGRSSAANSGSTQRKKRA